MARIISGKKANMAWNRIAGVLEAHGITDVSLARAITEKLVNEGLIEGSTYDSAELTADVRMRFIKLHPDAATPKFAHATDAGADLVSVEEVVVPARGRATVGTGIAIELPRGKVGLVHPRSGLASKEGVTVLNTPGTIDSGYRGEVKVILYNSTDTDFLVKVGERIAQLVVQDYDTVSFVEVEELSDADRGDNGFGSTGKK
jgi:dUTP pyrophosphatase